MRGHLIPALVFAACCTAACSLGGGEGSTPPDRSITLSGTLTAGPATVETAVPSRGSAAVLAEYKLSCVTFSAQPVSGTATADSAGGFSLTFDAKSTPFGCFVLDPLDAGAASVFFNARGVTAQTMLLRDSASFGTITVDVDHGIARASVPPGGNLVTGTPAGVSCPVGTWTLTSPCGPASVWIAATPTSQYVLSFTASGGEQNGLCVGVPFSKSNVRAEFDPPGHTLSFSFPEDNGCAGSMFVVAGAVDASCRTGPLSATVTACQSCGCEGCPIGVACIDGCCGCGNKTCPRDAATWTRQ